MSKLTFIDFETTGLDPKTNYPTEIAIKQVGFSPIIGAYEKEYSSLIQLPEGVEVSEFITGLTGITTEMCNTQGKPLSQVIAETQAFLDNDNNTIIAQSANFDLGYLSVHFGYEPELFYCTKTIEMLTAPHLPNGLNETHARYAPEKTFEQTHRAMDDVNMLMDILEGQMSVHGYDEIKFFLNKIAVAPERPLVFTPYNAKLLDFNERYVSRKTYDKLKEEK